MTWIRTSKNTVFFCMLITISVIGSTSWADQVLDEGRVIEDQVDNVLSVDVEQNIEQLGEERQIIPSLKSETTSSSDPDGTSMLSTEELFKLGQAHESGDGVSQSMAMAWMYYHRAAEVNHVVSQYKLAEMSFRGIAVPVNYARAASWYKRAADGGDARAQRRIGEMYMRGTGVPRDLSKGQYWLAKAAENGVGGPEEDQLPSRLVGAPSLEVIVEHSLSDFGLEVYEVWEKTLNPELLYRLLARKEGIEVRYVAEDAVRLYEENGSVVITLPVLTYVVFLKSSEESFGPWFIHSPAIEYRASPDGADHILFSMELGPSAISVQDETGLPIVTINTSEGTVFARWSKILDTVSDIEMHLTNIGIASVDDGADITIGAMHGKQQITSVGNGLWRMPSSLELNDLILSGGNDLIVSGGNNIASSVKLGNWLLGLEAEGSLEQIRGLISQFGALSGDSTVLPENIGKDEVSAEILSSIFRSFSIETQLSELTLSGPSGQKIGGLGKGKIAGGFSGLDSETASFNFSAGYEGVEYEANKMLRGLVPHSANIDIGLVSVPMKPLWDEIARVAQTKVADSAEEAEIVLDESLVFGLLQGSDAHIHLRDISMGFESYSVKSDGRIYLNQDGIVPVFGNFSIRVIGIDALLSQPLVASFSLPYQEQINHVIRMGLPTEYGGLLFDFDVTKEGQFLLNDADLLKSLQDIIMPQAE